MRTIRYLAVITALVLSGAADAAAQQAGLRTATVRAGGLMYDRGGDATHMMVGLGADWTLTRHVLVEVEATWTPVKETWHDFAQPQTTPPTHTRLHLATATTGLQAQAILGPLRPYVGMAGGLFVHYDQKADGDRFPSFTVNFPAGLRADITDRFVLRGELRARFDVQQSGGSGVNLEQTVGLGFRF